MVLLFCVEVGMLLIQHRKKERKGNDMEWRYPVSGVLCFYFNVMEKGWWKIYFRSRNRILTSSWLGSVVFRKLPGEETH